jgi:hypothetical protein
MTPAELLERYSAFTESVVRLETRQHYAVPGDEERQRAYREGRPLPQRPGKAATLRLISEAVAAGKVFERVHIVDRPLSDYVRYELAAAYPENVAVGERVWIVDRSAYPGLAAVDRDFVVFDAGTGHASVVWYDYTTGGGLVGYTRGTQDDIEICVKTLDVARAHALPLGEFMVSGFRQAH